MKIISLFFVVGALFVNPAISKDYEYKQYLQDNNIKPLIKSSEENSVDIIEFSSFSCSHCAAFHNETLQELKESDVYKNINFYLLRKHIFDVSFLNGQSRFFVKHRFKLFAVFYYFLQIVKRKLLFHIFLYILISFLV